jgi:hypothetical protein
MADVLVVVTVFAFFALCVGFVWGCDRVIGPDVLEEPDATRAGETVVAR